MIRRIEFEAKNDYDGITFRREPDSPYINIDFHRHNGMTMATFKFNDFRKALNVLNGGARWIEDIKEYVDAGYSFMDWRPDTCFCSRCGHGFSVIDNCTEEFDFCPACGAEMDGGSAAEQIIKSEFDEWEKKKAQRSGIGERIKKRLERIGMSQRELSERCHMTEVSISRYVNGARVPSATVILDMAKALNTTPDYLLGVSEGET